MPFCHHSTVTAQRAPANHDTLGRYNVIQEDDDTFSVFDCHASMYDQTDLPTLAEATQVAEKLATQFDLDNASVVDARLQPFLDIATAQENPAVQKAIVSLVSALDHIVRFRDEQDARMSGTGPMFNDAVAPEGQDWNDLHDAIEDELNAVLGINPYAPSAPVADAQSSSFEP
jgi:hypothetical protein